MLVMKHETDRITITSPRSGRRRWTPDVARSAARFAGSMTDGSLPRVPPRFTPGFMPSPAPQA